MNNRDSNIEIYNRERRKGHELIPLKKRRTLGHKLRTTEKHYWKKQRTVKIE